jgi:hypothetical protein
MLCGLGVARSPVTTIAGAKHRIGTAFSPRFPFGNYGSLSEQPRQCAARHRGQRGTIRQPAGCLTGQPGGASRAAHDKVAGMTQPLTRASLCAASSLVLVALSVLLAGPVALPHLT